MPLLLLCMTTWYGFPQVLFLPNYNYWHVYIDGIGFSKVYNYYCVLHKIIMLELKAKRGEGTCVYSSLKDGLLLLLPCI